MPDPELTIRAASEADVRDFAKWRYEAPFEVYSITDPVDEAVEYFLRPTTRCHVIESGDELAGFITFGSDGQVPGGDYTAPATDIGLGIRPDLTGRGLGAGFVAAVVAYAEEAFGPDPLRVTIATANVRARKVWAGLGFTETQRFQSSQRVLGTNEFAVLERGPA